MAPGVQEDVGQGVPDLARRPQDAGVKPLGEDPTAAAERPVERARDAGAERHHAAREGTGVGCFNEEVRVVGLQV
jgi:hypothetical protein